MVRISTKVELYLKRIWDTELLKKIPDYGGLIRVFSLIKLKTRDGWSETYRALIDTGAHTSVIPKYIWKSSEHRITGAYEVRGLVPNDDCKMDVKIGKLRVIRLMKMEAAQRRRK